MGRERGIDGGANRFNTSFANIFVLFFKLTIMLPFNQYSFMTVRHTLL
jgi:hypothetical protein